MWYDAHHLGAGLLNLRPACGSPKNAPRGTTILTPEAREHTPEITLRLIRCYTLFDVSRPLRS
jgi:hypothetical protein